MAGNVYTSGQLVTLSTVFTVSGIVADPTTVKFKYENPTGGITTLVYNSDAAVVKDSTGVYHASITAVSAGVYYYRWEGWTAVQAAQEDNFVCATGRF